MKKMMMAALLMVAGVFGMNAQSFSPRVEVGAAFSNMSFDKYSGNTKVGLRAGAAVEIGLGTPGMVHMYLAPGVTYKMGGYNAETPKTTDVFKDFVGGVFTGDIANAANAAISSFALKTNVTTHNISVPVNIGMRAAFGGAFAASVEVGPYFSYALAGKAGDIDIFENNKEAKRFDAGLGVSAALEYSRVYLRLGTEFGFVNQFGNDQYATGKNKNFYTTLGFRF